MKRRYLYRSSVTGKFVSAAYAKRYPHLTVRERVRLRRDTIVHSDVWK